MKRRTTGLAGLLLLASIVASPSFGKTTSRPAKNVLLVTLDTTRFDRLGIYGYKKPTSANLDSLGRESVVFDLAIAQASITPVSHASILTGLYPYHHHLRVMHGLIENRLLDDQVTLAEVWQAAGGQTAAFVSAFPVTAAFGLNQGFEHFDSEFPQSDGTGLVSPEGDVNTGLSQRRSDATTDAALTWLKTVKDGDKPFLMWVHYFDPHDAFILPPRPYVDSLMNGVLGPPTHERADIGRALYDCELSYMDSQLGRLLRAVRERGLWDRTIVVVVADHGEGLGDHNWWSHGILYQEEIHVPCIVRVPGIEGGTHVKSLVRTIDLMPTVLEAAAVDPARWPKMDGESLLGAMRAGQTPDSLVAYSGAVNMLKYGRRDVLGAFDEKTDKLYCLMNARYKLVYHQLYPKQSEFFDLSSDPQEKHNLASTELPMMARMLKELKSRRALSPIMPGMTEMDLERVRRLESLGYIN